MIVSRPEHEPDCNFDQVLLALRRIMRAVDLHSRVLQQRYGLTGPQLVVMKSLKEVPGGSVSVGQLARAVHLSQATVTGILSRLETRGLVERTRSAADRRCVMVSLTEAAQGVLAQTPPMLQDRFQQAFRGAKDWEQHQIVASLQRVVSMMEADGIDATPMLASGPLDGASSTSSTSATTVSSGASNPAGAHDDDAANWTDQGQSLGGDESWAWSGPDQGGAAS